MHFSAVHFTGLHFTINITLLDLPCIIILYTSHSSHFTNLNCGSLGSLLYVYLCTLLMIFNAVGQVKVGCYFIHIKTKNDKNDDYRPLDLFFSFIIHNFNYYTIIYTICILLYVYNYVIISDIIFPKKHLI